MEGEENGNKKKKTKLTIGVSLEAYGVIKDLLAISKEFKTLKDVASDFILWSSLAIKEANGEKEVAEKKVNWMETDIERLKEHEGTLIQEGKSARAALGALEDKYSLLKFGLCASYVVFAVATVVSYVFYG